MTHMTALCSSYLCKLSSVSFPTVVPQVWGQSFDLQSKLICCVSEQHTPIIVNIKKHLSVILALCVLFLPYLPSQRQWMCKLSKHLLMNRANTGQIMQNYQAGAISKLQKVGTKTLQARRSNNKSNKQSIGNKYKIINKQINQALKYRQVEKVLKCKQ